MTEFIFLNGPPGSGKDYLANSLGRQINTFSFSEEVKRGTNAAHLLKEDTDFEHTKDMPQACFKGKTPREAWIHYAEVVMKPRYGKGIFGYILAKKIIKCFTVMNLPTRILISDLGFKEELTAFIKTLEKADLNLDFFDDSADKIKIIRLFRKNHNFTGDSRGYIAIDRFNFRQSTKDAIHLDAFTNDGTEKASVDFKQMIFGN